MPASARSTPAQPASSARAGADASGTTAATSAVTSSATTAATTSATTSGPPDATPARTRLVDVSALQPGLHVELDLGWLDHPFPSNRFRLRDPAQIAALASLGLSSVRVRTDLSEPAALAALALAQARQGALTLAASTPGPAAASPGDAAEPASPITSPLTSPPRSSLTTRTGALPGVSSAIVQRRAQLARQRRSLARSERQHGEAVRAWQALARAAQDDPVATGRAAGSHALRLIDELDSDADTCLRVLHHAGGGPPAALHGVNVTVLSLLLARRLGLPADEQQAVALGALLHDIGKLMLPEPLRQSGPEQAALALRARREHVQHGVRLGMAMGLEPAALRVIAQHHELHDGSGLPLGLRGDDICRPARVVALVDRYERLCNPASPGGGRTPHEAQAVLYAQLRTQLDPVVLGAFVKLLGVYPPGTVVQLTDGRHALVVAAHPDQPLAPSVLVHDSGVPRDDALLLHLHAAAGLGIRRSLPPQHLPRATLDYLAPTDRQTWYHVQGLHDHIEGTTQPAALDASAPVATRATGPTV